MTHGRLRFDGRAPSRPDPRRQQLEALAAEGDEAAVGDLRLEYPETVTDTFFRTIQ